jgi:hypothetical protein
MADSFTTSITTSMANRSKTIALKCHNVTKKIASGVGPKDEKIGAKTIKYL